MIQAAGYVRVSTAGQAEHGLGLDIQREAITEYCQREGLQLVAIHEDAGISGANGVEDREGWPQLVSALEAGEFTRVVVMRLDRLARDLMLQENMLANVQLLGGELVSIDEPDLCDGDPTRKLFRQIKGAISEYEKNMIVARLRAGRRRKVRNGGYAGGWLPYGYVVQGEGTSAKPAVETAGMTIVRRVFAAYARGASMKSIADTLNRQQVPTARGGRWAQATVRAILTNDFYLGATAEPIISTRQFQTCQRRMAKARKR